jgi:hypothetical protein
MRSTPLGRSLRRFGPILVLALSTFPAHQGAKAQAPPDALWTIGNCNLDRRFDMADAIAALDYLFAGTPRTPCVPLCDVTGDGRINLEFGISLFW